MRVVLDTNVFVSAAAYPKGVVGRILELAADGKIDIVVSPFILSELAETLAKPKIGFDAAKIRQAVDSIKEIAEIIEPKITINAIPEENADNHILECAVDGKVAVLVTGNMKHIRVLGSFQGIEILTPREFLDKHFPGS